MPVEPTTIKGTPKVVASCCFWAILFVEVAHRGGVEAAQALARKGCGKQSDPGVAELIDCTADTTP
jgi:hypothetical protein